LQHGRTRYFRIGAARVDGVGQENQIVPADTGGVRLLPSRGEVVTVDHVRELMDQEGI